MREDDSRASDRSRADAADLDTEERYRELLSCLGDEVCRRILVAAASGSRSAPELAEACDVSRSTVYRRLNRLVDLDLVSELPRTDTSARAGSSVFRTTIERLEVSVGVDGLAIETHAVQPTGVPAISPVGTRHDVVDTEEGPAVDVRFRIPIEHAERLFEEWGLDTPDGSDRSSSEDEDV